MRPLPSPELMFLSVNSRDPEKFLARGAASFAKVIDAARQCGLTIGPASRILEWGCGCGRISRHFESTGAEFHGIDINADAAGWCRDNLTFGKFAVCDLLPPTELPSEHFDLIYAGSVLTHLSVRSQILWMQELFRLLKPDGRLLLTFHGAFYIVKAHTREGFVFSHVGSGLFAEIGAPEGSNLYGAYQTRESTKALFYLFEEVLHIQQHDILGGQDTIVFKKAVKSVSRESWGADDAYVVLRTGDAPGGTVRVELKDLGQSIGVLEQPNMLANQTVILRGPVSQALKVTASISKGSASIEDVMFAKR